MTEIPAGRLKAYRQRTFRLAADLRMESAEEALRFVNERGFVYFWPIKGVTLPNLWAAVAGERPVADAHDDPGHVTWGWKDGMLDKRQWYYAKILRGKATMIALEIAPFFYALSENYGDPDQDYLQLYEDGLLSREAKLIYEALLREGPLDTVNLRRKIHMTGKASNSPFERGLTNLQRDFKILPMGIAEAGAWRYSFIYDLVHRHYPGLPDQARPIKRSQARQRLLSLFFDSLGAATAAEARKVFQWPKKDLDRTLAALVESAALLDSYQVEGQAGEHYAVPDLVRV
ncbi:MAG TPA: crosslink repair DNA glycosylase YcaQ family protein [Anaerolineae bacterium]|nr:crosslink repair DNA glycosylase YcaQ family protein [Anaerolineae bacterium]